MTPQEWVTSGDDQAGDIPNPVGFRILIKPYRLPKFSAGGIALVGESKQYADIAKVAGQVLKMGSECYRGERFSAPWCKIGDYVIFPKHAGQTIEVKRNDGQDPDQYLLVNDDEIRAVVKDPSQIKAYL
jgi:co-chaperonin GroES (HSP10)